MIALSGSAYANAFVDKKIGTESDLLQSVIQVVQSQILNSTNVPAGQNRASEDSWGASKKALKHIESTHQNIPPGCISISFLGETHKLDSDAAVAASVLGNHGGADLIFYERKLHANMGGPYQGPTVHTNTIREEQLTTYTWGTNWGQALGYRERDLVIAGYLVACAASGDQAGAAKIILLCGENHVGILHRFNQLAESAAPWLLKRKRLLHFVKSHDTCSKNQWGVAAT